VFRAAIKLCGNMAELDKKLSASAMSPIHGHTLMHVTKPENQLLITFDDGVVLGEVNASLEQALKGIAEQQFSLEFEVFAPVRAIRETISRATKEKDAIVRVQINIYGPRKSAQEVGRELSQMKIYLQSPDYVRDDTEYDNPHVLKLANHQCALPEAVIQQEDRPSQTSADETLKKTIADVYSSLTRDKNLQGLEGDERLKTRLLP
jgi:SWI/SNF-related matrix-associated actin-dependent regulator of chromatin subfamily A3